MRNISQQDSLVAEAERAGLLLRAIGRYQSLRDPIVGECAPGSDFSASQIHVLVWLGAEGPLTMGELARRVAITEKTITGVVDRLERDGLLERARDQADRRVVRVALTKKGLAQQKRLEDHMRARLADFLGLLDQPDRAALFRILENLVQRIAQQQQHPPGHAGAKEDAP